MTRHGLSVLIFLLCFGYANSEPVRIQVEPNRVMLQFAVQEIQAALSLYSISSTITNLDDQTEIGSTCIRLIKHNEVDNQLQPQGFQLLKEGNTVTVNGGDEPGLMYGGLELADQIRLNQGLKNITNRLKNPFIERRGIKFNIPLDGRTPSYDDTGDAAQKNIAEMWNFDFWREFLDDLARYRYNTLTLWNPHPFPSLVHLPNYPDCELEDVCVPAIEPVYEHAQWRDPQFVAPHVLQQMKTVKKMTMDEKIQYWRKVMKYAKERGIAVYIITWNVIMNSAEGKYGITVDQDNPKTIAYLRECTKQLILTYPDLEGIGVTAGENMRNRDDEFDREKWLWQTYGLGVLDAKEKDPDRVVHFIHRVWNSGLEKIMTDFAAHYPDPFTIGFKYARAHLYSSPRPPFADGLLKEMDAYPIKCWWNLRNDDIFHFQWGDPDYVRAFLRNLPPKEKTAGYHMGSDGYVWAREHISRYPETPRQLECKKHWFRFMAWGKLGYDPALSNDYFKAELAYRYANINVEELFLAFTSASKIIPQINRFHWHDWDFQWAPEACFDQRNGFHDVKMFIETRTMEGSGILTIPEYVKAQLAKEPIQDITPVDVARNLSRFASQVLKTLNQIEKQDRQREKQLHLTLQDLAAMAHLGNYYASKILGSVYYHQYESDPSEANKKNAVTNLLQAQRHWEKYATVASRLYSPQLLARTRKLDWWQVLADVKKDVAQAEKLGESNNE